MGKKADISPDRRLILFHKPKGVVVTRSDNLGRRTVYDCLPEWVLNEGWQPVGRLDSDTRGLLLFTTDGKSADKLTRPGACVKTYEVWVRGRVTADHVLRMLEGIPSRGEILKAMRVELRGGTGSKSRVLVHLDEGRNRHIRRLFGELRDPERGTALKVTDLKRIGFGCLELDIPSGQWRFVEEAEIEKPGQGGSTTKVGTPRPEKKAP
jgi:23S rRNA pseudouridine2605 synthase